MDTHIIRDPNIKTKLNTNLDNDLSLNTSAFFLSHDDDDDDDDEEEEEFELSDVEMITVKSVSYTSLKDLLPASPTAWAAAAAAMTSPKNNTSWQEIFPIKNPLVKQAALAYLQPMSSPPEVGDNYKGLFGKFKDVCCCQCECFVWIYGVVFRSLIADEDEDDEKVD